MNSRFINRFKRIETMLFMNSVRGGKKRARYLKRKKIFGSFGENCYWFPRKLPAEPQNIFIHNNVNIATEVYFCDHDVIHHMLNNVKEYTERLVNNKKYTYTSSKIEICDNVFIGARAIIMGNIRIGENVIIAAGSVVTKDVESNSVYGGNPAKKICSIDEYLNKRKEFNQN